MKENYLRPSEKRIANHDEILERAAQASSLIATADSMMGNFELAGTSAFLGTVYPSALMASRDQAFPKPSFASWLQKRSTLSKNERIVQEVSAKIRHHSTCGSREFVTNNFHDILYRRIVQILQKGLTKECAAALHSYGLGREFFTDQMPALRQPLQLEDSYKKIDTQIRTRLLHDCQELSRQQVMPKRRKKGEEQGSKRRSFGSATQPDSPMEEEKEVGEDDGEVPGMFKKKVTKPLKKKPMKEEDLSKCSLKSWRPNKNLTTSQVESKPMLVVKYIEGHTCSVRRKIHMSDFLGAWTMFWSWGSWVDTDHLIIFAQVPYLWYQWLGQWYVKVCSAEVCFQMYTSRLPDPRFTVGVAARPGDGHPARMPHHSHQLGEKWSRKQLQVLMCCHAMSSNANETQKMMFHDLATFQTCQFPCSTTSKAANWGKELWSRGAQTVILRKAEGRS